MDIKNFVQVGVAKWIQEDHIVGFEIKLRPGNHKPFIRLHVLSDTTVEVEDGQFDTVRRVLCIPSGVDWETTLNNP